MMKNYLSKFIAAALAAVALTGAAPSGAATAGIVEKLFIQSGTGAVARTYASKLGDVVSVKDFGAKCDNVTNDAAAFQLAITKAMQINAKLRVPSGSCIIEGAEFVLTSPIIIEGDGRNSSKLIFKGSPTKTVRTYVTWRTEYDSGNYAASSDAAIACGFVVQSQNVIFRDLMVRAYWDGSINHPVPFNSATDFPTSDYDCGVLVQLPNVSLENVTIDGVWSTAALIGDASQPGGGIDGMKVHKSVLSGMWGVRIEGAHGQPISGDDYADLVSGDTRGAVGASDVEFSASEIYDTSGSVRLTIDGSSNLLVRRSVNSGALYVSGQNSANSAKRIQGMTFNGVRFAASDPYVYSVNYANNLEFIDTHSEFRTGAKDTDGVSALAASSAQVKVTKNARKVVYIGGEKSGESDQRVRRDTANNAGVISESNFHNADPVGSIPAARMLSAEALGDREVWNTFTLVGSTTAGTPTFSTRSGWYAKIGNIVYFGGRLTLSSKGGMVGNITIGELPFTVSNLFGTTAGYGSVTLSSISFLTTGDAGTGGDFIPATKTIQLTKLRSGASTQNITDADFVDSVNFTNLEFAGWYMTEEP